jgi:hypothetical protein
MKIRLHYRKSHRGLWTEAFAEVGQVPQAGEYIAPAPINVYRVVLTLHVLFDADYAAEVFAELVDFDEIQKTTLGRPVWTASAAS